MSLKQHLIDPEICIRCNTCEETCPRGAVSHDANNYVVDASVCEGCGDCLGPCPTGAIDKWRQVLQPYTLAEQLSWQELPLALDLPASTQVPAGDETTPASHTRPPASAPTVRTGLFSRAAPLQATLVVNQRLTTPDGDNDVRHLVLDLGDNDFPLFEGQSIGIQMPGCDAGGRQHTLRMYSVASPRTGEEGNPRYVALCVKRDIGGLCSNYLCDMSPGVRVDVVGPFGNTFLVADDPQAHLVMVAVGTGIAPFRSFVQRRITQAGVNGERAQPMTLVYGGRRPEEMAHHDWLQSLPPRFVDVRMCYSRQPGTPKRYAQDALTEIGPGILAQLARPHAHLYLCGVKELESGVDDRLSAQQPVDGRSWTEIKEAMRQSGRYHVEVF